MTSTFLRVTDSGLASFLRFHNGEALGADSSPAAVDWPSSTGTPSQVVRGATGGATGGHPWAGVDLVRASAAAGDGLYVAGASVPRLDVTTGSFTVGAWVRTDILNADVAAQKTILAKWEVTAARQWRLFMHTSDQFLLEWSFNGTASSAVGTSGTVITSKTDFFHVVATYDRTNGRARVYLDGAQDDENSSGIVDLATQTTEVTLGHSLNTTNRELWWDGVISEAFFLDRALSAAEVAALYSYGWRSSVHSGYHMANYSAIDYRSRNISGQGDLRL